MSEALTTLSWIGSEAALYSVLRGLGIGCLWILPYAEGAPLRTKMQRRPCIMRSQDFHRNWERTLLLEHLRLTHTEANQLFVDLPTTRTPALRLLHVIFERSGWNPSCSEGRNFLCGLLCTLPDNKVAHRASRLPNAYTCSARCLYLPFHVSLVSSLLVSGFGHIVVACVRFRAAGP
jgi:hypothetical protein